MPVTLVSDNKDIEENAAATTATFETAEKTIDCLPTTTRQRRSSVRVVVAVLALLSITYANLSRQVFNQALSNMVKRHTNQQQHPTTTTNETTNLTLGKLVESQHLDDGSCRWQLDNVNETIVTPSKLFLNDNIDKLNDNDDDDTNKFDWSSQQIAILLSAFSYGYVPPMILVSRLSEMFGTRYIILMSSFLSTLCNLSVPYLAHNFEALIVSRVVMGASQTGIYTGIYALACHWLHHASGETSLCVSLVRTYIMIGMLSGSLVGGLFSWQTSFYLVGAFGLCLSLVSAFLITSHPQDHWLVNSAELDYIQSGLDVKTIEKRALRRKQAAPWRAILSNKVVLALIFTKYTMRVSSDSQSMQMPLFLNRVMHMPAHFNASLNAINFAVQGLLTGLVAYLAREFVTRRWLGLTKTNVRGLFQGSCNFGLAAAFLLLSFSFCSIQIVLGAYVLFSLASTLTPGGESVIPMDITADYPATIIALANTFASIGGILTPFMFSTILGSEIYSLARWSQAFVIVAGLLACGGLVFVTVIDTAPQDFKTKNHQLGKKIELRCCCNNNKSNDSSKKKADD